MVLADRECRQQVSNEAVGRPWILKVEAEAVPGPHEDECDGFAETGRNVDEQRGALAACFKGSGVRQRRFLPARHAALAGEGLKTGRVLEKRRKVHKILRKVTGSIRVVEGCF
jgi:hypothetical protein